MGADYYLVPTALASQYPWAIEQLDRHAMQWPGISGAGRNLKASEVRAVLDDLSDYSISYSISGDNWQAEIQAAKGIRFLRSNALLNAVDYAGDEASARLFCLEKVGLRKVTCPGRGQELWTNRETDTCISC